MEVKRPFRHVVQFNNEQFYADILMAKKTEFTLETLSEYIGEVGFPAYGFKSQDGSYRFAFMFKKMNGKMTLFVNNGLKVITIPIKSVKDTVFNI